MTEQTELGASATTPGAASNGPVTVTYRGVHAVLHVHDTDCSVSAKLRATGLFYEEPFLESLAALLPAGRANLVLDIGAHIGNHTVFFAHICEARVIAFEPSTRSHGVLQANIAANALEDRVTAIQSAVGAEDGVGHLHPQHDGDLGTNSLVQGATDDLAGEATKIRTIDSLSAELDLSCLVLMKIDVEGFEADVLRGARETIATHQPVITTEILDTEDFAGLNLLLGEMGYRALTVMNPTPTVVWVADTHLANQADALTRIGEAGARHTISQGLEKNQAALKARKQQAMAKTEIAALQSKITTMHTKITALQTEITALQTKITALQTKITALQTKITALHEAVALRSGLLEKTARKLALRSSLRRHLRLRLTGQIDRPREVRAFIRGMIRDGLVPRDTMARPQGHLFRYRDLLRTKGKRAAPAKPKSIRNGIPTEIKPVLAEERLSNLESSERKRNLSSMMSNYKVGQFLTSLNDIIKGGPNKRTKRRNNKRHKHDAGKMKRKSSERYEHDFEQLKSLGRRAAQTDFVVLVNAYPSAEGVYGGEFIRTRVEAYVASGLTGCVIELNRRNTAMKVEGQEGLIIARLPILEPEDVASVVKDMSAVVLSHSPSPELQNSLNRQVTSRRLAYWFHGFEVRDYRRLYFNFSTEAMAMGREKLDEINFRRWAAAKESFQSPNTTIILISEYLKKISIRDVGAEPNDARVIHNFIDLDFFSAADRRVCPSASPSIMMLRPFIKRNYGTDIATRAIKLLSTRPGFEKLSFTIRGFGDFFEVDTDILKNVPNVRLEKRYSDRAEVRDFFSTHDIGLFPSRHDTQGVTLGEAMASGVACITNSVAAIPEFADSSCAVLVKPDCVVAYAEAIWDLAHDPARVRRLGDAAVVAMGEKCGRSQTIEQEIALIEELRGRVE